MTKLIHKEGLLEYTPTMAEMEGKVANIISGEGDSEVWFLEHPPVYTAGTSAAESDLKDDNNFPVHKVGRGGKYTYHGPGQRVVYLMLKLKDFYNPPDLKKFVCELEQWVIDSLQEIGIESFRRAGRVGIWCFDKNGKEAKIAAIGIRVRKWVSFHGVSINVEPDLSHFNGIVPCGISEFGVTSIKEMGIDISMAEFDKILQKHCKFL